MNLIEKIIRLIWIMRAAYLLGQYTDSGWSWRIKYARTLWSTYADDQTGERWKPEDAVIEDVSFWYE